MKCIKSIKRLILYKWKIRVLRLENKILEKENIQIKAMMQAIHAELKLERSRNGT